MKRVLVLIAVLTLGGCVPYKPDASDVVVCRAALALAHTQSDSAMVLTMAPEAIGQDCATVLEAAND